MYFWDLPLLLLLWWPELFSWTSWALPWLGISDELKLAGLYCSNLVFERWCLGFVLIGFGFGAGLYVVLFWAAAPKYMAVVLAMCWWVFKLSRLAFIGIYDFSWLTRFDLFCLYYMMPLLWIILTPEPGCITRPASRLLLGRLFKFYIWELLRLTSEIPRMLEGSPWALGFSVKIVD